MSSPTEAPRPKAVLVGVQLPGVTDAEQRSSPMELQRLCKTLGFEVVGEVTQKRKSLSAATPLGEGKLVELAAWIGGTADPVFRAQMQVTREVLDEIGAGAVPRILVLNKIDQVAQTHREELLKEFPDALLVSARTRRMSGAYGMRSSGPSRRT